MRESAVQQRVILRASELDVLTMRNNSGALFDENGRLVRYGLMNESKQINSVYKSSDLIGITPINAYLQLPNLPAGWYKIGVFTAIETKPSDWSFSPKDKRAVAQANFHKLVIDNGGFAGFATSADDVARICYK